MDVNSIHVEFESNMKDLIIVKGKIVRLSVYSVEDQGCKLI